MEFNLLVPDSPLKRQPSKDSIKSAANSTTSAALEAAMASEDTVEGLIQREQASAPISAIPPFSSVRNSSPGLIRRNPSITSSAGDSKLGRIQLTLKYSVARQKLMIIIHKVA